MAWELRADKFRDIMTALQEVGDVRIFVRSRAAVLEVDGNLGQTKYSVTGPFFNVDGGGIDMHIMHAEITTAFAVEKQSHQTPEDKTYSIQFYDSRGDSALKLFLWQDFPSTPAASIQISRRIIEEFAA